MAPSSIELRGVRKTPVRSSIALRHKSMVGEAVGLNGVKIGDVGQALPSSALSSAARSVWSEDRAANTLDYPM
jgi:hypothetical protein